MAFDDELSAVCHERQLKRWTTEKKQALIAGDMATLNDSRSDDHVDWP